MDKQTLKENEAENLHQLQKLIVENPEFENLKRIFRDEIPPMEVGVFREKVKPVGGAAKIRRNNEGTWTKNGKSHYGYKLLQIRFLKRKITT